MTESTLAVSPSKPAALWEDFIDVFTAPARVFERRRGRGFGAPLFITALLFAIVAAATAPLTRPLLERQMEQSLAQMRENGMTEEQLASARGFSERVATVSAVAGPALGMLIFTPLAAAVLLGVAKAFGAKLDFSGAGLASTYSLLPGLVSMLVGAVLLLAIDVDQLPMLQQISLSPALLLGPDASPIVSGMLGRFGLGEIWSFFVTAVGVRVLGRTSSGAAYGISGVMWVLGTILMLLLALRQAAAMGG